MSILNELENYMDDELVNDYNVQDESTIDNDIVRYANEAIKTFKESIDIWDDIKITYVDSIDELGKFRSGTASSTPSVLLNKDGINDAVDKYNVPLETIVTTTIFHELGHAMCEYDFDIYDSKFFDYDDEEEFVEDFAEDLYKYGQVSEEISKLLSQVREDK